MAAMNSVYLRNVQKVLNSYVFRSSILPNKCRAVSRYSTESTELSYTEKDEEKAAMIEKKRNKSRLLHHHRILMEGKEELPAMKFDYQLTVRHKRRNYAKFGRASGIDPSIMWPTKEELRAKIEEEKEFHPPLEEMLTRTREKRLMEKERIIRREEQVEYNMSKLGKWMADLKQKRDKKVAEIQAQKDKKEDLIEEVRQYFGYRLSPKDPKFVEILEKKEKEEKKIAKDAKKKERFAKEMAKLASIAQAGSEPTAAKGKTAKDTNAASKPIPPDVVN